MRGLTGTLAFASALLSRVTDTRAQTVANFYCGRSGTPRELIELAKRAKGEADMIR